jgi:hypothetical protein
MAFKRSDRVPQQYLWGSSLSTSEATALSSNCCFRNKMAAENQLYAFPFLSARVPVC